MKVPVPFIATLVLVLGHQSIGDVGAVDTQQGGSTSEDGPAKVLLNRELVSKSNATNNTSATSMFMEGGTMNKSVTPTLLTSSDPQPLTAAAAALTNVTNPNLPTESELFSTAHDKNSSIKARKGVLSSDLMDGTSTVPEIVPCACCVNITTQTQLDNCLCCNVTLPSTAASPVQPVIAVKPVPVNIPVAPAAQLPPPSSTIKAAEKTTPPAPASASPSPSPSPVPHHHKPNVTADVPDQQVPAKQEDYVIPVVGIIFAIPLIIILGALVYKKGADLWERRHYRRMDFLIDGIYNQ